MTTDTVPETDALSVGETGGQPSILDDDAGLEPIERTRNSLGRRAFGLAFLLSAAGTVLSYVVNLFVGDPSGIVLILLGSSLLVGFLGLIVGLVGVWLYYARASVLVPIGVLVGVASIVGIGVVVGVILSTPWLGNTLLVIAVVLYLGLPLGLTLVGLGLRRSVTTLEWISLVAALPLTLFGFVATLALAFVTLDQTVITLGAGFVYLALLTGVPLGLRMMRQPDGVPTEPTTVGSGT